MSHYDENAIKMASNVDLIGYLVSKGYVYKRSGHYYKFKVNGHDIEIKDTTRNLWKRWSTGQYGDSIEFLRAFLGYSFPDAVGELLGICNNSASTKAIASGTAPEHTKITKTMSDVTTLIDDDEKMVKRVYAYLIKTRCLGADTVKALFKHRLIGSDSRGNVNFYHYDVNSKEVVGVSKRGTVTGSRFFRTDDCVGGLSFFVLNTYDGNIMPMDDITKLKVDYLVLLESPIDTLSYYELYRHYWRGKRVVLVSLSSVSRTNKFAKWYKNLGLHTCVLVRTDNDLSGKSVESFLASENVPYSAKYDELIHFHLKDYNELLKARRV